MIKYRCTSFVVERGPQAWRIMSAELLGIVPGKRLEPAVLSDGLPLVLFLPFFCDGTVLCSRTAQP
nr:MAG TPA: hypothetical protein [Bacteriophage sp.]